MPPNAPAAPPASCTARGWLLLRRQPKRCALAALGMWVLIAIGALYPAYKLFGNTSILWEAPSGTRAAAADAVLRAKFAQKIGVMPFIVTIKVEGPVLTGDTEQFISSIRSGLGKLDLPYNITVDDYYSFAAQGCTLLAQNMQRTVGAFNYTFVNVGTGVVSEFRDRKPIADFLKALPPALPPAFSVEVSAVDYIFQSMNGIAVDDMRQVDIFTIPLAILVMAYVLESVTVLILPLVTILISIVTSMALLYGVSLAMPVSGFTPELVLGVCAALGIDYTLFILSRFKEETEAMEHRRNWQFNIEAGTLSPATSDFDAQHSAETDIVIQSAKHAGHNIIISGTAVTIATGGLLAIPVNFLASMGAACGIAAAVTMVVNITLLPSLLLLFPRFFARNVRTDASQLVAWCRAREAIETAPLVGSSPPLMVIRSEKKSPDASRPGARARRLPMEGHKSVWYRIGVYTQDHPFLFIAIIAAVGVPFFVAAPSLATTFDVFQLVPSTATSVKATKDFMGVFGPSASVPYYIITEFNAPNDPNAFAKAALFLDGLAKAVPGVAAWAGPANLTVAEGDNCWGEASSLARIEPDYKYVFEHFTDSNRTIVSALRINFDPMGDLTAPFIKNIYAYTDSYAAQTFSVYLTGGSTDEYDIMVKVHELTPIVMGASFTMIFVFVGLCFRSLFIPFRLVATMAYTVFLSYGLGYGAFCTGWLSSISSLKDVRSVYWAIPTEMVPLIMALALDYDIFLLTRVAELRARGFTDRAALIHAVDKTGRVISFAGVIMAIAFGSFIFSSMIFLKILGTLVTFSVIVDTFIIRTLFVPALMALKPGAAWWPRVMPPGELTEEDSIISSVGNSEGRVNPR